MKAIERQIKTEATDIARQFRAVCIVGPRQSGKTTLSKLVFKSKDYINLENPNTQADVVADTLGFLKKYKRGAVLDEAQRVPDIFRYLQELLDNTQQRGLFILTGSNNFLLQEQISQSLAGRVGYLELLPLSYAELRAAGLSSSSVVRHIFTGGYPEIWQQKLNVSKWMASYVQTYIQRDVRLLRNISNLGVFIRFVQLCATYAGQILNKDALAKAAGIDAKTVQSWLAVLESSYILYLLQPYHNNLSKRIIKSPKLYFYDTGLLCYLLNLHTEGSVLKNEKYGALFENWMITEIRKNRYNKGISGGMYYFRDSAGNEVDLILEKQGEVIAVEVKAGKRFNSSMIEGLHYWQKYNKGSTCILLYSGDSMESSSQNVHILNWMEVEEI